MAASPPWPLSPSLGSLPQWGPLSREARGDRGPRIRRQRSQSPHPVSFRDNFGSVGPAVVFWVRSCTFQNSRS